ncbi:YbdD/YjiX family protein [Piscinibacter koreensis]|uniref:YbdD/YjiX family protein n=1 Tax=Piscinibacter koreensis TaxID=2742824 RepID=A0A7Y6NTI9_9BURK|nr:YbdD/YjiX family protein [Schlegelella koreensis]NUZ09055.1 YbdD/YjiX family protein [Schlegelella koreensis]
MTSGARRLDIAHWAQDVGKAGRLLADSFRLMVGVPPYGAYVRHMEATHPGKPVMDYETFFRERQQARYGRGTGRCC